MVVLGIDFTTISFSGCLFNTKSNSKKYQCKENSYKENGLKKESDLDLVINDFLYFLNVNMSKLLLINKIKLEDYIKVDRLLTLLWVLS